MPKPMQAIVDNAQVLIDAAGTRGQRAIQIRFEQVPVERIVVNSITPGGQELTFRFEPAETACDFLMALSLGSVLGMWIEQLNAAGLPRE